MFIGWLFFPLFWFAVAILLLVWVYQDAQSRGMNGGLWAVIVFFLSVLGLILYLVIRENSQQANFLNKPITRVCPQCGQVLNQETKFCPRCGKNLE